MAFRDWWDLIRDHLLSANQGYGKVLFELQHEPHPLTFERQKLYPTMKGLSAQLLWVSNALWTFVSPHLTKSFRKTVRSFVNGEELNGLELLRAMWLRFEGGASEVEVADLGALHEFPQCPDGSVL